LKIYNMQIVLVPTTKSSHLILTNRSLCNLFSNIFDNLTGWWECTLYKLIYEVYYFIFLGIYKALNRFRVEFIDRTLSAIKTLLQRCTVDIILLWRARKIRRKLFSQILNGQGHPGFGGWVIHVYWCLGG